MRTRLAVLGLLSLSLAVVDSTTRVGLAQGIATRAGQAIDGVGRGIKQEAQNVGSALRRRFDSVRAEVNRMGIPSRVYSRLHWDKSLTHARIEVHPVRGGGVLLRGTVPDDVSKTRALALASETVDVTSVIDELTVLTTATAIKP